MFLNVFFIHGSTVPEESCCCLEDDHIGSRHSVWARKLGRAFIQDECLARKRKHTRQRRTVGEFTADGKQGQLLSEEQNKKMDTNKVWQWRIMCVDKYSRHPEPFHCSNRIGLDFNVASNNHQKLDIGLVTNGVILEVCDFAKTVNKSKRHFFTNILENNFDLDLENDQQRIDFTSRIMHKVKNLIRKPPKDKHEVFTLFDTPCNPECSSSNEPNMASTKHKTESILVETDNTDDWEHEEELQCSHATSKDCIKAESLLEEMDRAQSDDSDYEDEFKFSEAQSAEKQKDDDFSKLFPFCEKIGLNLDFGSKQSLEPGLLTKGIMLELIHFTRILTASYSPIVLDVLEHNFELDLKSQQEKNRAWFKISHLLKKRTRFLNIGTKISPEFKTEPFSFQTNPFKRHRETALSDMEAPQYQFKEVTKRRQSDLKSKQAIKRRKRDMETNTLSHHTHLYSSRTAEGDHCHTCPVGKSDSDSDSGNKCDMEQEVMGTEGNCSYPLGSSQLILGKATDSGNVCKQNQSQNPKSSLGYDIPRKPESNCLHVPFLNTNYIVSTLPTDNLNVIPPLASQHNEGGHCGVEEKCQTPINVPNKSDVEQEEMETEHDMWKLRANRVRKILSTFVFSPYYNTRKFALEFNVGFSAKKNISVDNLRDKHLLEVAKFSIAINSSKQDFIMEILEHNFDFGLQSEYQQNVFTLEIMNRVRELENCEDAIKFSNEVFELPGRPGMGNVKPQLCNIMKIEECEFSPLLPPHSQANTSEHISQKSLELYPFCQEIGLKLNVYNPQQNKKLDIDKLTNGSMTEVTNFAEKLCGKFAQICLDILKHNFCFDFQSGDSDLAGDILARIPFIVDKQNLSNCAIHITGKDTTKDSTTMVKLDCQRNPHLDACGDGSSQSVEIVRPVGRSTDFVQQDELHLKLWKCRANHIKQILSVPHEEHCPLYSFSRCQKLGIDFNVGSGIKQNLDPKLLTNAIMAEINSFAAAMLSAQKHFITEILEYNLNLDFKNELYRSAFTQQLWTTQMNIKRFSKPWLVNNLFELPSSLPDLMCLPNPSKYCPKCFQERTPKLCQNDFDPSHIHRPPTHTMAGAVSDDANYTGQKTVSDRSSTFYGREETIMDSYRCCQKNGFMLFADEHQPKSKKDRPVLTCGIMNEVARFTKKLCGTKLSIIKDVLEHNFNIGMQGKIFSPTMYFHRATPDWFNEVYVIRQYARKQETTHKKRKLALQTKKTRAKNYTCPLEESDLDSVEMTDSENLGIQNHLKKTNGCFLSSDIPGQLESSCLGNPMPSLTSDDISSSLPNVNSNVNKPFANEGERCGVDQLTQTSKNEPKKGDMKLEEMETENSNLNPPFANQPMERGCFGVEAQTQTSRNTPNKCDVKQEEMETENNLWKLRANRARKILSTFEFGPFYNSKKLGLEFHVGFGAKLKIRVDNLQDNHLLEIATFALAMNSSKQDFIMEILEHNFNFGLQSEYQRNIFTLEIMNRVRMLENSKDAIKFSNEICVLPILPGMGDVKPQLSNILKMEECDVAPGFPTHSQAKTSEHFSQKDVDLYPFCQEIGLKLNVNNRQPNKLDINKLTNGSVAEVTNFAEKLCGTFEQICLDILTHNFDFHLQSGYPDLARSIVARIHATVEQRNLKRYVKPFKRRQDLGKEHLWGKLKLKNNLNTDGCSAGSSHTAITNQEVGSSAVEQKNELDLKLWKVRENRIQQILSTPHTEHCPLYSYSRCRTLGIDFNVGSGEKLNLDPKSLTNGIMVELNTFATALISDQKHFVTEILEYNFPLDLKNELYREAYKKQLLTKIKTQVIGMKMDSVNKPFELPDLICLQNPTKYCPKCFQERSHKTCQVDSDPSHMHHPPTHTMADAVSGDANCTAPKPEKVQSSSFSAIEEMIVEYFPACKNTGLNLFVDKDQARDKLDTNVLTREIMLEVVGFARSLCGTKGDIIGDILEHNFNIDLQGTSPASLFYSLAPKKVGPDWFNEGFKIPFQSSQRQLPTRKSTRRDRIQDAGWREVIEKRKLALQTKEEKDTVTSDNPYKIQYKSKKTNAMWCSKVISYPNCTEIGLDLDVTNCGEKEKLHLRLLTHTVVWEINKYKKEKKGRYLPSTWYDILDYNFDISSQHKRSWEFSIAVTTKVQSMLRGYDRFSKVQANKIFELPFLFASDASPSHLEKSQNKQCRPFGHFVRQMKYHSGVSCVHFLEGYKTKQKYWILRDGTKVQRDPRKIVQNNGNQVGDGCGSPLQGNLQIKEEDWHPCYGNIKPEPDTEEKYCPLHDDVKTESNPEDVAHFVPGEPTGAFGYTLMTALPDSEIQKTEPENENVQYYILGAPQGIRYTSEHSL
ncbi:uncharacterized protein LOC117538538 [Gymnodraco acuticeps]|uniref:Uncharacterized protein LOC117538538 n=1 Tax=Gymnodraco acuticeps TaxID=8218 RepID=A0A6P8TQ39_GYMAC|nr:uncharacterized protein LOC117538538 [Gymnodraco acuticeps]